MQWKMLFESQVIIVAWSQRDRNLGNCIQLIDSLLDFEIHLDPDQQRQLSAYPQWAFEDVGLFVCMP